MIEMLLHIAGAFTVLTCAALRLNVMKAERATLTVWSVLEVLGLAAVMGGSAGAIGEWFLPDAEFSAETILIDGMALFAIGISRGNLCQVVARLTGWDGQERRTRPRPQP